MTHVDNKFGSPSYYSLWDLGFPSDGQAERQTDRQTDGHGHIGTAVDAD